MTKILVVYLISAYDDRRNLEKFIENYKKNKSGCAHDLLICFKNFNTKDSIFKLKKLKNLKYIKYKDNNNFNDFDWGSYLRVAKKFNDKIILFMNCHSYPIIDNWLKILVNNYSSDSLIGPSGSYESHVNNSFSKLLNINFIRSLIYAFSNFIDFPIFPNPHIRSNCFMISSKNFQKLKLTKKYKYKKKGTWINESGRYGMSKQLKQKKFRLFVINSDGKKFDQLDWKKSNTYAITNQSKLIISDKYSRIYENSNSRKKKLIREIVWGKK